jgi:hypothetical protein
MGIPVLPIVPDFSSMIGFCHHHGNRKRESALPLRLIPAEKSHSLTKLPHHRRFVDYLLPWLR